MLPSGWMTSARRKQVERGARCVDRDAARLPVVDGVASLAQQFAVHGAHDVALGIRLLDEELLQLAVGGAVEEDALGRLAVASGAARLLVVLLEAAGEVVMDHPADVREVDAHAERGRGDDRLQPSRGEALVDALPRVAVDGAVIRRRRQCRRRASSSVTSSVVRLLPQYTSARPPPGRTRREQRVALVGRHRGSG